MRTPGKYRAAILACWMLLCIPLVTGIHHHSIVLFGPGDETLAVPSGGNSPGPDYPPCSICLRLIVTAETTPAIQAIVLSVSNEIASFDNNLLRPPHLFSPIGERAPPLTLG
jgi:hypothetical protein